MLSNVIGGAMLPHAPQFFTMPETEDPTTVAKVKEVAHEIGGRLKALKPDLWIIFANDRAMIGLTATSFFARPRSSAAWPSSLARMKMSLRPLPISASPSSAGEGLLFLLPPGPDCPRDHTSRSIWRLCFQWWKSEPRCARGSCQPLGHRSLRTDRAACRLSAGLH